jgi:hypothetical protein
MGGATTSQQMLAMHQTSQRKVDSTVKILLQHVEEIAAEMHEDVAGLEVRLCASEVKLQSSSVELASDTRQLCANLQTVEQSLMSNLEQAEEKIGLALGPMVTQVQDIRERVSSSESSLYGVSSALLQMQSRVEHYNGALYTRLDGELAYMKERMEQGIQLLTTHVNREVSSAISKCGLRHSDMDVVRPNRLICKLWNRWLYSTHDKHICGMIWSISMTHCAERMGK